MSIPLEAKYMIRKQWNLSTSFTNSLLSRHGRKLPEFEVGCYTVRSTSIRFANSAIPRNKKLLSDRKIMKDWRYAMESQKPVYRFKPPCPGCPYKLGQVQTLTNPCPQCKENSYQAFERFQKKTGKSQ